MANINKAFPLPSTRKLAVAAATDAGSAETRNRLFPMDEHTDTSKPLALEGPKTLALRSMVINGSIVVESQEDRERKKAERAKKRKSRWDNNGSSSTSSSSSSSSSSSALVPLGSNITGMKQKYNVVPQLPSMINVENTTDNAQEIYLCNMGIRDCTNRVSIISSQHL